MDAPAIETVSTVSAEDSTVRLEAAVESSSIERLLRSRLPKTEFVRVSASSVPGLFIVKLANGSLAFTNKDVSYLMLGLAIDTSTGKFVSETLTTKVPKEVQK